MISIQGISCSAGIMPMLACLPIILLTEIKSLSGSLSMVVREGEGKKEGEGEGKTGFLIAFVATCAIFGVKAGKRKEKQSAILLPVNPHYSVCWFCSINKSRGGNSCLK